MDFPTATEVSETARRILEREQLQKFEPLKEKRTVVIIIPPLPAPPFEFEI